MFLSSQIQAQDKLQDRIVSLLAKGELSKNSIFASLLDDGFTRQGVHKALNKLKLAEVVIVHKKMISLNFRWLKNIALFSNLAQHFYTSSDINTGGIADLHDGEKISYVFANLKYTDAFWNHAIYILLQLVPPSEDWYAYNPHMWFFLARPQDEMALLKQITRSRKYLITVGSQSKMDLLTLPFIEKGKNTQYCFLKDAFFAPHYYLNILGDYLIEVKMDAVKTEQMEDWFNVTTHLDDKSLSDLKNIVEKKSKIKLSVTRNAKKAARLKKLLGKSFV